MAILGIYIKQPEEIEDYSIDYTADLDESDELVSIEAFTDSDQVDGDHLDTLKIITTTVVDKRAGVRLAHGVEPYTYKVTVRVTSRLGRVLEDEFKVKIKDF